MARLNATRRSMSRSMAGRMRSASVIDLCQKGEDGCGSSVFLLFLFLLFQIQRGGVDAVAQSGRTRTVREDMPKMRLADGAHHLRPPHPMGKIFLGLNPLGRDRLPKARPAAPRLVFGFGSEELIAAGDAA